MNSCCTQPIDVIVADQHHGESCCLVEEKTPAPAKAACPVSGTLSRKVQRRTMEHLLKLEKIDAIQKVQYYFCKEPACNVVYFSNENVPFFAIGDVAVKVFVKDRGAEAPVCYCFDWTRAHIKQQISKTGKSTAALEIAREIKAGNCACDIKNPKGECCLGDVNAFVKEVLPMKKEKTKRPEEVKPK
ncbi:(2Fe-2S)-binding protein [candidate division KSB1 bacterium]|nr:MAG: (2Fe-2S)-binding protein [candidate division KSB1 bacterium]MBC6951437.1 (2Fe-2S)-binding protein [candidate division KSB1 bacterium]MDL1878713.1 (2Fe-2S)-binding protein [Cytophagia bacterium CHB2]RIK69107.1 MAG: (2Fe-2S)-binding protein [candidate division KSB1 bacterium]